MKRFIFIFSLILLVIAAPSLNASAGFDSAESPAPPSNGSYGWDSYGVWARAKCSDGTLELGYFPVSWQGKVDSSSVSGTGESLSSAILKAYTDKGGEDASFALELQFAIAIGTSGYGSMFCSGSQSKTCGHTKPSAAVLMDVYGLSPDETPADGHYPSRDKRYADLYVGAAEQKASLSDLTGTKGSWGSNSRNTFDVRNPFKTGYSAGLFAYKGTFESIYPEHSRTLFVSFGDAGVSRDNFDAIFNPSVSQNGVKYLRSPEYKSVIHDGNTYSVPYVLEEGQKILYLSVYDDESGDRLGEYILKGDEEGKCSYQLPAGSEFVMASLTDNCSVGANKNVVMFMLEEQECKAYISIRPKTEPVPIFFKYVTSREASPIGGVSLVSHGFNGERYSINDFLSLPTGYKLAGNAEIFGGEMALRDATYDEIGTLDVAWALTGTEFTCEREECIVAYIYIAPIVAVCKSVKADLYVIDSLSGKVICQRNYNVALGSTFRLLLPVIYVGASKYIAEYGTAAFGDATLAYDNDIDIYYPIRGGNDVLSVGVSGTAEDGGSYRAVGTAPDALADKAVIVMWAYPEDMDSALWIYYVDGNSNPSNPTIIGSEVITSAFSAGSPIWEDYGATFANGTYGRTLFLRDVLPAMIQGDDGEEYTCYDLTPKVVETKQCKTCGTTVTVVYRQSPLYAETVCSRCGQTITLVDKSDDTRIDYGHMETSYNVVSYSTIPVRAKWTTARTASDIDAFSENMSYARSTDVTLKSLAYRNGISDGSIGLFGYSTSMQIYDPLSPPTHMVLYVPYAKGTYRNIPVQVQYYDSVTGKTVLTRTSSATSGRLFGFEADVPSGYTLSDASLLCVMGSQCTGTVSEVSVSQYCTECDGTGDCVCQNGIIFTDHVSNVCSVCGVMSGSRHKDITAFTYPMAKKSDLARVPFLLEDGYVSGYLPLDSKGQAVIYVPVHPIESEVGATLTIRYIMADGTVLAEEAPVSVSAGQCMITPSMGQIVSDKKKNKDTYAWAYTGRDYEVVYTTEFFGSDWYKAGLGTSLVAVPSGSRLTFTVPSKAKSVIVNLVCEPFASTKLYVLPINGATGEALCDVQEYLVAKGGTVRFTPEQTVFFETDGIMYAWSAETDTAYPAIYMQASAWNAGTSYEQAQRTYACHIPSIVKGGYMFTPSQSRASEVYIMYVPYMPASEITIKYIDKNTLEELGSETKSFGGYGLKTFEIPETLATENGTYSPIAASGIYDLHRCMGELLAVRISGKPLAIVMPEYKTSRTHWSDEPSTTVVLANGQTIYYFSSPEAEWNYYFYDDPTIKKQVRSTANIRSQQSAGWITENGRNVCAQCHGLGYYFNGEEYVYCDACQWFYAKYPSSYNSSYRSNSGGGFGFTVTEFAEVCSARFYALKRNGSSYSVLVGDKNHKDYRDDTYYKYTSTQVKTSNGRILNLADHLICSECGATYEYSLDMDNARCICGAEHSLREVAYADAGEYPSLDADVVGGLLSVIIPDSENLTVTVYVLYDKASYPVTFKYVTVEDGDISEVIYSESGGMASGGKTYSAYLRSSVQSGDSSYKVTGEGLALLYNNYAYGSHTSSVYGEHISYTAGGFITSPVLRSASRATIYIPVERWEMPAPAERADDIQFIISSAGTMKYTSDEYDVSRAVASSATLDYEIKVKQGVLDAVFEQAEDILNVPITVRQFYVSEYSEAGEDKEQTGYIEREIVVPIPYMYWRVKEAKEYVLKSLRMEDTGLGGIAKEISAVPALMTSETHGAEYKGADVIFLDGILHTYGTLSPVIPSMDEVGAVLEILEKEPVVHVHNDVLVWNGTDLLNGGAPREAEDVFLTERGTGSVHHVNGVVAAMVMAGYEASDGTVLEIPIQSNPVTVFNPAALTVSTDFGDNASHVWGAGNPQEACVTTSILESDTGRPDTFDLVIDGRGNGISEMGYGVRDYSPFVQYLISFSHGHDGAYTIYDECGNGYPVLKDEEFTPISSGLHTFTVSEMALEDGSFIRITVKALPVIRDGEYITECLAAGTNNICYGHEDRGVLTQTGFYYYGYAGIEINVTGIDAGVPYAATKTVNDYSVDTIRSGCVEVKVTSVLDSVEIGYPSYWGLDSADEDKYEHGGLFYGTHEEYDGVYVELYGSIKIRRSVAGTLTFCIFPPLRYTSACMSLRPETNGGISHDMTAVYGLHAGERLKSASDGRLIVRYIDLVVDTSRTALDGFHTSIKSY